MEIFPKKLVKNPTPHQIAVSSALLVAFLVTIISIIISYAQIKLSPILEGVLNGILAFSAALFIFRYYLKKYIYRKVKVIYKTIHKQKLATSAKEDDIDISADIMKEVEAEVEAWAESQEMEIRQLKTWQEYRRKFLGDISHELKTPIFNIQGFLETLLDGGLEDESINRTYVSRAAKNVERLNTIVEDLEIISRLESGELILDIQKFDIKTLAEEVFEDLELKASDANISLIFKLGADRGFSVLADREYIRQVLINLVNNSIKYGNADGATKVSFYDMDKNVLIEVADSGIGIPEKHLKHVFDRFYRVDKSRSREQGGSGLGLSIVKHIVEAHKQTINVRSTQGIGSTFGFTLQKA